MAELLDDLGVHQSHSKAFSLRSDPGPGSLTTILTVRPNYSGEALFKTLKYRPDYPQRFESIQAARAWCREFFDWYSHTHYHSGIGYLRPADLHAGRHHEILARRQEVLDQAHAAHPERFNRRPKPAIPPAAAWINKPLQQT
jgi:putative transposase